MTTHLGFIEIIPYCTSKAAARGLIRGLAVEWVNDSICVSGIAPGWFPSETSKQVMILEWKAATLTRMPVRTFSDPKDLGKATKSLPSNHARYITSQDSAVGGGASTHGYQTKKGRWEHPTPRWSSPTTISRVIPC